MATTIVEMQLPPGLSNPQLFLYPDGSDTLANTGGDNLVEEANRDGLYLADVTEALTGVHYARVEVGGTTIGSGFARLQDDTNTYPVVDSKREAVSLDANVSSRSTHTAADVTGGTNVAQAEQNIRGADSDDLKNISDQVDSVPTVDQVNTKLETEHGAGSWVGDAAGSGDTEVTDATADDSGNTMEVLDGGGAGIEDVTIRAYNKSDFDASNFTVRATTSTDSSGEWGPIMLNTGTTYTITFEKSGLTMGQTEVTP